MTHKITVDVTRAVQDFYPGLTTEQIDYMAETAVITDWCEFNNEWLNKWFLKLWWIKINIKYNISSRFWKW